MAANESHEWVTVSAEEDQEETKIVFDTIGDEFVGTYLGMRQLTNSDGSYQQARFQTDDGLYFTNAGYSLKKGLADVRKGALVRVEYSKDLDTGQDSPMKVYTVQVARQKASNSRKASNS